MKFHQLPLGARFRFRGEVFRKASPLLGQADGGPSRVIAKSARVELLGESPLMGVADDDLGELGRAIEELAAIAEAALGGDEQQRKSVRMTLARSRKLLKSLGKRLGNP